MTHISGFERSQLLLLPEVIDDYIVADNPVRFIDAFVDGLDLAAAGFKRITPKGTGRPGYAPGDLLKLYIYGYLNRVRSSRRLEAECHRNIEVIWLLRTLKPDFKTIADFRSDNRAAFRAVFRQFTLLCRELNLFGRELLAVDGTRIKAVNNKDRNFTKNSLEKFIKAVDKRLDEYLRRLDESDVEEAATDGSRTKNLAIKIEALREKRGRYGALLTELERSGESQISLTDPDSRAMAAHTKVAVGYNIQVAVDAKNKMIVDQEVTNQVVDMGLLTQTAEPARSILEVEAIDVVADRGYFKIEDIEACEKAGMTPYVPKPQRGSSVSNGFFRKDEFRYDAERDAFICPAGQVLSTRYESKLRELTKIDYSNRAACLVCAIKSRCTKDYRKVSRLENEAVLDRMAARLKARPEILDRRREMVEHPFGSMVVADLRQWRPPVEQISRIGMDTSKHFFQLHGVNAAEKVVLRKKLRRKEMVAFFKALAPTVIGIEACGAAHYLARLLLGSFGHEVKLIAPQLVKPYVKRGKNDGADAEALCEAMSRPSMRFVPVKTAEQQAALMMVGLRDRLIRNCTQLSNAIRGYAAEFGFSAAKGKAHLVPLLERIQADESVPVLARELFTAQAEEYARLQAQIDAVDVKLLAWHKADESSRRLVKIPGVGPIGAVLLMLKTPAPELFRSGRQFAAWIGLTPKDHSTAGKVRLGGITRAGDEALRSVLVVGATSVIQHVRRGGRGSPWIVNLLKRKPPKLAAVALANKMARVAWKLMVTGERYAAKSVPAALANAT